MTNKPENTVGDLMRAWLRWHVAAKKPATQECYKRAVQRAFLCDPSLKETPVNKLTGQYFQGVISELSKKYAKSTVHHTVVAFHQAFKAEIRAGNLQFNPISVVSVPSEARVREVGALSRDEVNILLQYLVREPYRNLVEFLLYTGLRRGEAASLEPSDYDRQNRFIRVRKSKTKHGIRLVPLTPEAQTALERQLKAPKGRFIFTTSQGNPVSATVFEKLMQRIRRETGIRHFTLHMLRHTFATMMVESKADYKALSNILGHADVAFTLQRYASVDLDFLRQEILRISNVSPEPRR